MAMSASPNVRARLPRRDPFVLQMQGVSWRLRRGPSIFTDRNNNTRELEDCLIAVETRDRYRTGGSRDAETGKCFTLRLILDARTGEVVRDYPGPSVPSELTTELLFQLGFLDHKPKPVQPV